MSYASCETHEEREKESDYELFAQTLGYDLGDMTGSERSHLNFQWKMEVERRKKNKRIKCPPPSQKP